MLSINPKLLVFVEGTDAYNNDYYWWGGNLEGVKNSPVVLNVANQLVYSAHDYGPSVYGQSWFNGSTTASSLGTVWTNHWAYVSQSGVAPVWLGEFGTGNNNSDAQNSAAGSEGQWFQSLVGFLGQNAALSWTYWALNGEDSLALLDSNYDSTPVSAIKQSMLAGIQFPLNGGGTTATPPAAPSALAASAASSTAVNLSWRASATAGVTYTIFSGGGSTVVASGVSGTSYQATGLTPSTTYTFVVKAASSAGTSAASNQASATTQAATAVPAAPTGLSATASSATQINLSWVASSTAGATYSVYDGVGSGTPGTLVASGVGGTSYQVSGLTGSTTYSFVVRAVSGGGTSAASNQASATTQAAAGGSCHIAYLDQNDWGSGFTGNLSITAGAAVTSWTVSWSYGGNQTLNQSWNSNYSQNGKTVTLTNASWNGSIAAGATLTGIGWNAAYSGTNAAPTVFYLNGVQCH